ncbi:MAG: relaxase/mobilization nuclease domain-containing protein, partial [Cyanobacteriota bacterium]|nr:relaxase/mobilization nuclease domain-containing protein [Cyanobacteriota bacterium]
MTAALIAKQIKGSGFRGLLNYVEGKEGARRIGGNMVGRNARELAAEFKLSCQLSARVKKPVYHVSMSVPKGTELDDKTWNVLAQDYLEKMDFTANQYAVYRHTARSHEHIHIVASRVRLDTGKAVDDAWDFVTSKKVLNELAKTHGLAPLEAEVNELDRRAPTTGQKRRVMREQSEYDCGKRDKPPEPTVLEQLQDAIDKASLDKPTMPEL